MQNVWSIHGGVCGVCVNGSSQSLVWCTVCQNNRQMNKYRNVLWQYLDVIASKTFGIQPKSLIYCLLCLFVNNLIQKAGVVWRWPKLKCIVCAIICNYWQIICYIIPIGCAMQCEGRFRKIHLGLCTFFTSFRSTTRIVVCSSNILENVIWTKAKAKMNFNLRNLILHCMRIVYSHCISQWV